MARQFTDGAEAGDLLFFNFDPSTATNVNAVARIGGRSYQINNGSVPVRNITAVAEFYVRFAWYWQQNINAFRFAWRAGGTELGSVRINTSTKAFDIYTSTATLVASGTVPRLATTWYVVEIHVKIADSGGVIEVKVDGVSDVSFSGDTKPGSDTTASNVYWNASSNPSNIDDLALNDTSGGVDDSWCGDAHIYALTPNGNGNANQFTGSDGNSTDNYLLVDEVPSNSDTDYVQDATSGHKDLYAFTNLASIPAGASVVRVIVETRTRELTAAGDAIQLGVRSGGVESFGSNVVVGISYQAQKAEFLVDPATGVAWLQTAVDALEAGVKIP